MSLDLKRKLIRLLADEFDLNEMALAGETNIVEDFGLDSLDHVELIMAIEEEFDIIVIDEEAEKIETIDQAVDYIGKRVELKEK